MKISFDLDDVLFVDPKEMETEPPLRFPFNRMYKERLRKGTVDLIKELQNRGFEVLVYTSSLRSIPYIRSLFKHYKVSFSDIINRERHLREVQRGRRQSQSGRAHDGKKGQPPSAAPQSGRRVLRSRHRTQ